MSDGKDTPWEQAAAFQKIWSDTFSKMTQGAFQFSPDSAPPEFMRQMRSSMFQALGKTWEEFMRSPEFLSSMKQTMDSAIAFKKMTNEFLVKAHDEMQGTSKEDLRALLAAVGRMEANVHARLDRLEERLDELNPKTSPPKPKSVKKAAARSAKAVAKKKVVTKKKTASSKRSR
jgi:imidazolonepropionase-like amidohydrolase